MINPKDVSLCLITKEKNYPKEILDTIYNLGFGEILILTNSDSPFRKYELFKKAKYPILGYQDDDAICPWEHILKLSESNIINITMKETHAEAYKNQRLAVGFGWGAIFPKYMLASLERYKDKYGVDELFKRETERILTYLNYPQNRLVLPIVDLPSAMAMDRLWRQPGHYENIQIVEDRCKTLL